MRKRKGKKMRREGKSRINEGKTDATNRSPSPPMISSHCAFFLSYTLRSQGPATPSHESRTTPDLSGLPTVAVGTAHPKPFRFQTPGKAGKQEASRYLSSGLPFGSSRSIH